ncbi:MAG: DNA-binding protein [Erysipelotrichaceae bacterium]|nr:DNA-binding protein [Erysipelotrichaceae bacterium]MDY5252084.1 PPC domain-containing DNA-binding protein [Erysipelotrichaceae bacterium]
MIICERLHRHDDLKQSIMAICQKHHIEAGTIISSVGCLSKLHLRLAKAKDTLMIDDDLEILQLNGTCSINGCHLHLCVSDDKGKVYGGHLLDGCIINTTCEIVILTIEDKIFTREYNQTTGYKELNILER